MIIDILKKYISSNQQQESEENKYLKLLNAIFLGGQEGAELYKDVLNKGEDKVSKMDLLRNILYAGGDFLKNPYSSLGNLGISAVGGYMKNKFLDDNLRSNTLSQLLSSNIAGSPRAAQNILDNKPWYQRNVSGYGQLPLTNRINNYFDFFNKTNPIRNMVGSALSGTWGTRVS